MNDYRYDNQTVEGFILSSIVWGVVGIVVGLLISVQMWAPAANFAPYFTFGRLRAVHTNGLAFGLGVGAIFGLSYYIVMRLCGRPLLFPKLARFQLWLFNVAIVAARWSRSSMGYTQSLRVRRAGVAARHRRRHPLGDVRGERLRHHHQAQGGADVHLALVHHRHGRRPWPCSTS